MKSLIAVVAFAAGMLLLSTTAAHAASQGGLPQELSSSGVKTFIFSPRQHMWAVYDADGNKVRSGVGSGGGNYCRDTKRGCRTPSGTFSIIGKRGANCVSSIFPLNKRLPRAKMPYCSFFTSKHAIHGYSHINPRANVSHGCIRVHTSDANWIQQYLPMGSRVIVQRY